MILAPRIEAALRLAPMTVAQLARCLTAYPPAVRKRLDAMPNVIRCGTRASATRPHVVYGLGDGR